MKKCLLKSLFILSIICPIFADDNFAANPVPADCISLTSFYSRAPEGVMYYTFGNPIETHNGYKSYFRVFIPPGAVVENMAIYEYGKQMAVARHNVIMPSTIIPENPPIGYVPDNMYSLSELEYDNQWVAEKEGVLYISQDSFYPYLDISRAGWLYVKFGGGQYSDYYSNQFTVKVDAKVYNEWWDKYIKNEAGWNEYVQNVGVYIDPTAPTSVLTVTPVSRYVTINAGTTTFEVINTGTGSMQWQAEVTQGNEWLSIVSGSTGMDKGTITCSYTAASSTRTGTIWITADGATNSPMAVTVVQEGKSTVMPIPATGQTTCYDADGNLISPCPVVGQPYFGQDANYQINPMSYTKMDRNGQNLADDATSWTMVRNNITGLIWDVDGSKRGDRNTTNKIVESLNTNRYGGYSDWRLPTVKELSGLVTYRIPYITPVINEVYFPNTKTSVYWSSTPYAMDTIYTWGVDFNIGIADIYANASNCYVRAVRGEQSEAINSDHGNGTVIDKNTGLMWQQDGIASGSLTWENALNYCETLDLGGYPDWRVPTIKELMSLADYAQTSAPAINNDLFNQTKSVFYWASTTTNHEDYASHAWGVDYKDGLPIFYPKETNNPVRAVRSLSMLSVTPSSQSVTKDAGSVAFNVFISGAKILSWNAAIVGTSATWLKIDPKGTNSNTGTITCNYTANTVAENRTATIKITATGAELNSPVDVTLTQDPECAATKINQQFHIPYLTYNATTSQNLSLSADFIQMVNPLYPGLELYKLSTVIELANPPLTCTPSTLSDKFVIHIPHVIINGTHFWMELTYNQFLSTSTDAIFVATGGGIITN